MFDEVQVLIHRSSQTCFEPANKVHWSQNHSLHFIEWFFSILRFLRGLLYPLKSILLYILIKLWFTKCTAKIHFGYSIKSLLTCDIPELQSDWFSINRRIKFGWEVTADGGSNFLIKFMMNILIKHRCFSYGRFSDNTKLNDDILLHINIMKNSEVINQKVGK